MKTTEDTRILWWPHGLTFGNFWADVRIYNTFPYVIFRANWDYVKEHGLGLFK